MEVYPKSSWFLLLLGFVLIAATLQEPGICPTPDQVSCTTGLKCNVDDDCDKNMICCSNSCYTKRCIPNTKGVQGAVQSEGPSESECRPYIEKALKELEIGEVAPVETEKESSEDDLSAEDIPTVEITDDSSHQNDQDEIGEGDEDDNDDDGKDSVETTESETLHESEPESEEEVQQESGETQEEVDAPEEEDQADESIDEHDTKEESIEEMTEVESEKSKEDQDEGEDIVDDIAQSIEEKSEEQTDTLSEEIEIKHEDKTFSAEIDDDAKQSAEVQREVASTESQATASDEEEEVPDEHESPGDSYEEPQPVEEDDESNHQDNSIEEHEQTQDDDEDETKETEGDSREQPGESKETESKETVDYTQQSEENEDLESSETNKSEEQETFDNSEEHPTQKSLEVEQDEDETVKMESSTEKSGETTDVEDEKTESQSTESVEEPIRCPLPQKLTCNIGKKCSEHKECSDDKICCPNKCYRKECVSAEAESGEDDDQPDEREETDTSSEPERDQDLKCPRSQTIACGSGDKCGRNNDCPIDKICCTNKCYRKQCVLPGAEASSEFQEQEYLDDDSKEEPLEPDDNLKCPRSQTIACGSGDKCGRNKDCPIDKICCTNKCYRKQCVLPGAEASSEFQDQEYLDDDSKEEPLEPDDITKCPEAHDIACGSGDKCGRNRDCVNAEICCTNKCYRRQCVPPREDSAESDDTRQRQQYSSQKEEEESEETSGEFQCPPSDLISCAAGEKCGRDKDCVRGYICCPNKCYRKQCIPKDEDDNVSKETLTIRKEEPKVEIKEVPKVVKASVKILEVKKTEIPRVVRQVKEKEPEKEEERSIESTVDVEDLGEDSDIPTNLRSREHVEHLLKLDDESSKKETIVNAVSDIALKELKRLYENAIKPLEVLYKYRDLSNRHFGDAEIFSKPLILFMGPWSGGKSSIINYLVNNEYNETSLRTGAEPSPAYFNILMHGEESEVIDGTQLAADFTFSGLQKFGQGLEERLRGVKLPAKLLEKVNIVEIPGILEVRKQVSRVFPFNDACQWFIDRADIIFLIYDPSKLDVGPETEAILDQLKGREHQTRIILNKADQVKPEELLRVQGALIWNISPLMSSPQPPTMYTTSLWSKMYEPWAPKRLLQAQERAFLRDLRGAIEKRIENKIGSARRFAVRVRNHAKMVDCYLTTYYNHKSVFGNRKHVANEIIEHPQDYHIYEGLSTLTNISRYDLPDPEVYRDFFKLNPLYEFQQLSATCTYFRGCPINRLDIAIAYDLPELLGTYKRNVEEALTSGLVPHQQKTVPGS